MWWSVPVGVHAAHSTRRDTLQATMRHGRSRRRPPCLSDRTLCRQLLAALVVVLHTSLCSGKGPKCGPDPAQCTPSALGADFCTVNAELMEKLCPVACGACGSDTATSAPPTPACVVSIPDADVCQQATNGQNGKCDDGLLGGLAELTCPITCGGCNYTPNGTTTPGFGTVRVSKLPVDGGGTRSSTSTPSLTPKPTRRRLVDIPMTTTTTATAASPAANRAASTRAHTDTAAGRDADSSTSTSSQGEPGSRSTQKAVLVVSIAAGLVVFGCVAVAAAVHLTKRRRGHRTGGGPSNSPQLTAQLNSAACDHHGATLLSDMAGTSAAIEALELQIRGTPATVDHARPHYNKSRDTRLDQDTGMDQDSGSMISSGGGGGGGGNGDRDSDSGSDMSV